MEELDLDFKELRVGDEVEGTVVSVGERVIYLDINQATEGTMYINYYTKEKDVTSFFGLVKVGDVIPCTVTRTVTDKDGNPIIMLSRLNQIKNEKGKEVAAAFDAKTPIIVTVEDVLEKGYKCSFNGLNTLFLPKSQAADAVKGAQISVMVIEANTQRNNFVVSRRAITDAEYEAKKNEEYDKINVGDVLKGSVIKVEKYGALVKFETVAGFLKPNQYSYEFVNLVDVLHVGDELEVKVVAKNNGKLELSKKALIDSPFTTFVKNNKVSDKITGKIVTKLTYGLMVEVAPGVKGLLHRSECSHNPNDNFLMSVQLGDDIEVAIIEIKEETQKVGLSRKALIDNPWERVDANKGDVTEAKIVAIDEKGLKVEAFGVEGTIAASETGLEAGKKIADYFAVGDVVKATVTFINKRVWKLSLSIKVYQNAESRKNFEKYLDENESATATIGDVVTEK